VNCQISLLAVSAKTLAGSLGCILSCLLSCVLKCALSSLLANALLGGLLLCAVPVQAQAQLSEQVQRARDAEWSSYRDAYKSMLWFEKFGKAKNLIQVHLQVVPKDKNSSTENYGLHILGKSIHLNLPLDALGRTALPLLKSGYDENAELVLNQKSGQANFQFRTSLIVRPDGIYDIAELRAACEQALAYQNYIDSASTKTKKCVGVRLGFAKKDYAAQIELRAPNATSQILPLSENSSLWTDSVNNLKTANFIFSQHSEKGQLITRTSPLGMIAIIE
jgi:hypothetical protein